MQTAKHREIGESVRKARKQAGLTQMQLAKLCNVTQATVQKIETGRSTNSRFLPKIWARLGLPLVELDSGFSAFTRPAADNAAVGVNGRSKPAPHDVRPVEVVIRYDGSSQDHSELIGAIFSAIIPPLRKLIKAGLVKTTVERP